MTSGQISYDLRRLRKHGLIERIPGTFRYHVTPAGHRQALFLTRLSQHLLITGLAELEQPRPPAHSRLRAATPRLRHRHRRPRPALRPRRLAQTPKPAETTRQSQT